MNVYFVGFFKYNSTRLTNFADGRKQLVLAYFTKNIIGYFSDFKCLYRGFTISKLEFDRKHSFFLFE